jgi:tetratricopeptide (TPR) repeat protein
MRELTLGAVAECVLGRVEYRDVRHLSEAIVTIAIVVATISAHAYEWNGCDGSDLDSRIPLCTKLIETPDIDPGRLAGAFSRRAFSYLKLGQYQRAIRDYDETIRILSPFSDKYALDNRAIAYNNRAVAYIRLGKFRPPDIR